MDLDTDATVALSVSLLEAVAGIITSSFIVFDILKNIFKGRVMSTRDKILLALSFSNMTSTIVLSVFMIRNLIFFAYDIVSDIFIYAMVLYCMSSCSWLTLCLCFFYYIKVMQFRSRYLTLMKNNIDVLIPWTVLVVEVTCLGGNFLNSALLSLFISSLDIFVNTVDFTNNTDYIFSPIGFHDVMYVINFVPYPLIIVTTVWIITSVTMHIRRMRRTMSASGTINLEAHHRVVRTMQHLVAFYLLFYILLLVDYWKHSDFPDVWSYITNLIILLTFSPVQSFILIHGNPRLKESWKQMLKCSERKTLPDNSRLSSVFTM